MDFSDFLQNNVLCIGLVAGWISFWLLVVDWRQLWPVLAEGAWAPVVLLALVTSIVWAAVAPSAWSIAETLVVPNYWWQLSAVLGLLALAGFCGWLQGVFRAHPVTIEFAPPVEHDTGHHDEHLHAATH